MHPSSSILHSLKDQIRNVKYSIRAEADVPGSMLPRALQGREIRRLTSLSAVVSVPAFRLADGIVTRVETIAMNLLGTASRVDHAFPEPVSAYLAVSFDFTDKLFQALKRIVDMKGARNVFVSEQALDAAWTGITKVLQHPDRPSALAGEGADPVQLCALLAYALIRSNPVRQVGFQPGEGEAAFRCAPSLHCGALVGLLIALATCRPGAIADGGDAIESVDSAVNARLDRFRQALDGDAPVEAIAAEYRKLIPFLP